MARGWRKPAELLDEQERVAAALPGYTLGHPMGAGAYGMVITARHRKLKRDVAIKMVASESTAVSGFAEEARILAGFDHPHIVRVFDYQETDGLGLIVMELLTGGTLTRRRRTLTQPQACAAGLAVAAALSHAHAQGVLHRDIKMDNVIFDAAGCPKVADFGIARIFSGSGVTGTGQLGTPMYMAPEQIIGGRLGPATDLYALGVLLYHLLAGQPPFERAESVPLMWQQTLSTMPPPPPDVAEPLAAVVMRALCKTPGDRHPDAEAFACDLAVASVSVHGPDWLAATGMPLHLPEKVWGVAVPATGKLEAAHAGDLLRDRSGGDASADVRRSNWWRYVAPSLAAMTLASSGLAGVFLLPRGASPEGHPSPSPLRSSSFSSSPSSLPASSSPSSTSSPPSPPTLPPRPSTSTPPPSVTSPLAQPRSSGTNRATRTVTPKPPSATGTVVDPFGTGQPTSPRGTRSPRTTGGIIVEPFG